MNDQIRAVQDLCNGHQRELDRIHDAEAEYERRHQAYADSYRAELVDHALKGERIHFACGNYKHDPVGVIADEMCDEDHHALVECVLNFKAGRMSAERAMEILADRVDSALLMAGKAEADYRVGS